MFHNPVLHVAFGLQFRFAHDAARRQAVVNQFAQKGCDSATMQELLRIARVPADQITTLIATAYPA